MAVSGMGFKVRLTDYDDNSLWDSFRSQIPFLTLVDPASVEEMIRSLIDTYVHLGWLPDCRMSLNKGYTQVRKFSRSILLERTHVNTRNRVDQMQTIYSQMDTSKASRQALT